jgi:membrane-associated HD superfamily phosphohydrolase
MVAPSFRAENKKKPGGSALCRVARLFYKDIGMMVAPSFRAENKKSRAAQRCAGSPGCFIRILE